MGLLWAAEIEVRFWLQLCGNIELNHHKISRVKVMECSARDNYNITELFKTLLALSKIIPHEQQFESNGGPLKRRSSAYVSNKGDESELI